MTVELPPKLEELLRAEVAAGKYATIDEGVAAAVESFFGSLSRRGLWDHHVKEALEESARGDTVDGDELFDELMADDK